MPDTYKKFFETKTAVTALFVIIALSLTYNTVKVVQRNYTLQQRVDELTDQVALVEVQNQNLAFNIEYYQTDEYLEVEAKRRFNLAEKGERVIFLPKDGDVEDVPVETGSGSELLPQQDNSNFDKWMIFLFGAIR